MMTHCATCGSPLLRGGGLDQLCGACLFESSRRPPAAELPDRLEQEEVARLFPELEILEPIGRGGMGVVWRARQKRLDREVALKLLRPELAEEPGFAERFQREARALARLSHANVVLVHDFGEQRGRYFLLMEFVKGVGLRDLIRDGRLTPARVLEIVPEICAGLQYAHENGVIHRDIKPENILIDDQGHVRIADFGLAKMLGQEEAGLTRTSQVMGTYEYMAPEQIYQPTSVDHRVDVYSLGVVLYEMLTGDLPRGRFASPSEKVPVDDRLDGVVAKALQEEREARYQSVGQVQSEVEEIGRSSSGISTSPAPELARQAPPLPSEGPQAAESAFVARGELDWLGGTNPRWVLALGLLGAYGFLGLFVMAQRLSNSPRWELFAIAYPAVWLVITLLRTRALGQVSRFVIVPLWTLALAAGMFSLVMTSSGRIAVQTRGLVIPTVIACGFLMLAHLLLERGLRRRSGMDWMLCVVLIFVGAIAFSASPFKRPYNALGFSLGMPAILCGATLTTWLPSAFRERPGREQQTAIVTCTVVGLVLAALYFMPLL